MGNTTRRPSRDRNGRRWTLYGLPGGYTTARPAGVPLTGWQSRCATPLLRFRMHGDLNARALSEARGYALRAYELVP